MTLAVYIDSCAWNYLYEKAIVLRVELPPALYTLYLTREVEIEIDAIPNSEMKRGLKEYIQSSIEDAGIETTCVFGFQTIEPDGTPSKIQTYSGFGQGTFQSKEDQDYYSSPEIKAQLVGKTKRNSGLSANQADASLAARSFQAIVLTNEDPKKMGPLKLAVEMGGKVVYLKTQVELSGFTLGQYLTQMN